MTDTKRELVVVKTGHKTADTVSHGTRRIGGDTDFVLLSFGREWMAHSGLDELEKSAEDIEELM